MIRRTGADGRVAAFDRFIGLFTSKAYAEEAEHIPILRAKLSEVLAAEGATAGSHDYKEIVAAFNSFPKEELFRASVDENCAIRFSSCSIPRPTRRCALNVHSDPVAQQRGRAGADAA